MPCCPVDYPAGKPGSSPSIQIWADGRPAPVTGTLTYAAAMTVTWTVAKTGVRTGKVAGKGLLNGLSWTLTGPNGETLALPTSSSTSLLSQLGAGVYIPSDTAATVKLPASLGSAGTWRLSFTPAQWIYPGATLHSPVDLTYAS